jgi:hypothetical protein
MDIKRFSVRINKLASNVEQNTTLLVRKVALSIDSTVVMVTPVDTGRARSNWQVEIGKKANGTIEPHVPGLEGSTVGPNTQIALALGAAAIATYKGGETIHLTNNLPYIGALNRGHSAQAPAGFVESAVLNGIAQVKGARLLDDNGTK